MDVNMVNQGGQSSYDSTVKENVNVSTGVNAEQVSEPVSVGYSADEKDTQKKEYQEKDIKKAADKLNKFLEDNNTHVEYEFHDKFKNTVIIKIVDDAGKTIKEIPPKKLLDVVAKMCEMAGILIDKKA